MAAEKAKMAASQEMQAEEQEPERLPEPVDMATDDKMVEKVEYDVKTGLNKDGSCVSLKYLKTFLNFKSSRPG